jgi:hypothetical protein
MRIVGERRTFGAGEKGQSLNLFLRFFFLTLLSNLRLISAGVHWTAYDSSRLLRNHTNNPRNLKHLQFFLVKIGDI